MKIDFKKLLWFGVLVLSVAAGYVLYNHFSKLNEIPKQSIDIALDSAAYYRVKVVKTDIDLKEAKQKLKFHENNIDSLAKDMANDSFAMAIRRSVLRSRIQADIRAAAIRDSLGRQHP